MIRSAVEADAAALAALSIEVWLSTYIKKGVSHEFAEYVLAEFDIARVREAILASSERFLVSENVDGIDGYIRISSGGVAPVEGCGQCEISTLYVQPRHQGRGIGAGLIREVMKVDALWLIVNSENLAAIGFYEHLGFRRVGKTVFTLGDGAYDNEVMAWGSVR